MKESIIVIGAGVAGIGATLELAERGYKVILIEKYDLGSGTSRKNPARMGHGFHYADPATAIFYLNASIKARRKFPGFQLAEDTPNSPLAHGRYFIVKGSKPTKEVVLNTYQKIQAEYARLVKLDPLNEVFGPPNQFFRILDPSEYQDQVNAEIIELGIETNECLFRWDLFIEHIRKLFYNHPNIELRERTEVLQINHNVSGRTRFNLKLKSPSNSNETLEAHYIVNSTCENIESLNQGLEITFSPGTRTNRLKGMLVIALPKELKDYPSMFFCMGPLGMFVNKGDGRALVTVSKLTNIEASEGLTMSDNAKRLLHHGPSAVELAMLGNEMLNGMSLYIPAITKARVLEMVFGVVRTNCPLKLNELGNPEHAFHIRNDAGVKAVQVGLIINPAMKLMYFQVNAELVAEQQEEFEKVDALIDQVIQELKKTLREEFTEKEERLYRRKLENRDLQLLLDTSITIIVQQLSSEYKTQKGLNHLSIMSQNATKATTQTNSQLLTGPM